MNVQFVVESGVKAPLSQLIGFLLVFYAHLCRRKSCLGGTHLDVIQRHFSDQRHHHIA